MSTKETTVKRIELESISREKVVNSVNIVIVDNYPDKFPTFVLTGKMALCRRAFRPTSAPPSKFKKPLYMGLFSLPLLRSLF